MRAEIIFCLKLLHERNVFGTNEFFFLLCHTTFEVFQFRVFSENIHEEPIPVLEQLEREG